MLIQPNLRCYLVVTLAAYPVFLIWNVSIMRKHLIRLSALSVLLLSHHVLAQCDSSFTSINTIQGTAETSPLLAKQLSTRGVVTAIVYPGTNILNWLKARQLLSKEIIQKIIH